MGLKIQANGPQKAQANAILEKVFTAITKVVFKKKSILFYVIVFHQCGTQHNILSL